VGSLHLRPARAVMRGGPPETNDPAAARTTHRNGVRCPQLTSKMGGHDATLREFCETAAGKEAWES